VWLGFFGFFGGRGELASVWFAWLQLGLCDENNFTKFYFVYFGVVRRGEFKKK